MRFSSSKHSDCNSSSHWGGCFISSEQQRHPVKDLIQTIEEEQRVRDDQLVICPHLSLCAEIRWFIGSGLCALCVYIYVCVCCFVVELFCMSVWLCVCLYVCRSRSISGASSGLSTSPLSSPRVSLHPHSLTGLPTMHLTGWLCWYVVVSIHLRLWTSSQTLWRTAEAEVNAWGRRMRGWPLIRVWVRLDCTSQSFRWRPDPSDDKHQRVRDSAERLTVYQPAAL